jgi:glutamate dehydrogenase/leucine dehydrogenase
MVSLERAVEIAIAAVEHVRRERYTAGHVAYLQGIRTDVISAAGVTGTGFAWAEDDHKKYIEHEETIRQLNDIIEILADPGVMVDEQLEFDL